MITVAKVHLTIAALMGLAGVALLAAAAHVTNAETVQTAGQMLLFHAPVVMAATAARKAGLMHEWATRLALTALMLGVALFAADLARRGFHQERLFAGAAPAGGFLMFGGWAGLALAAAFARRA